MHVRVGWVAHAKRIVAGVRQCSVSPAALQGLAITVARACSWLEFCRSDNDQIDDAVSVVKLRNWLHTILETDLRTNVPSIAVVICCHSSLSFHAACFFCCCGCVYILPPNFWCGLTFSPGGSACSSMPPQAFASRSTTVSW